ncbi:MAG: putative phosphoglycerol geranylgeranyltransferase [Natrialbaceae archaeon]|nr:putative phosphoglycerol geranylgeranyltransferase [Natrialbaceae archaeon]
MSGPWESWDHVLKIDPDKELPPDVSYADICSVGTDVISAGGTTGVTREKMERVIEACADADVPLYVEPSNLDVVVEANGVSGYLVPVVFNAGAPFWITGAHKEWLRSSPDIPWDRVAMEAYIVLNPDSDVARYTQSTCDLEPDEVAAYARVADRLFNQEIVYIEYSGMLGDPTVLEAAAEAVSEASIFYGGGIHDYDSAHQMASIADTIVVGNLVHDEDLDAVRETVRAAKDAA